MVVLPDGRRIRGVGVRRPRGDVPAPISRSIYLAVTQRLVLGLIAGCGGETSGSGLDRRRDTALREAWERAGEERVEIGCGGGIGRTGTALALLATMSGVAPEDAVAWVRSHYHRRAVETGRQRRWVEQTATLLQTERE